MSVLVTFGRKQTFFVVDREKQLLREAFAQEHSNLGLDCIKLFSTLQEPDLGLDPKTFNETQNQVQKRLLVVMPVVPRARNSGLLAPPSDDMI